MPNSNISSTLSSQYSELRPTNGWDRLAGLGHPSKFQWVSRLGYVTAATSFTGDQPNFARCLAVSCAGTLCIHFRGSCPLTEFCQLQNSFCVQVLRSHILAALLHGTRPVGVSQTLQLGTRNGITELSQTAPPIFGWAVITLGIGGPHSSYIWPQHWRVSENCVLNMKWIRNIWHWATIEVNNSEITVACNLWRAADSRWWW